MIVCYYPKDNFFQIFDYPNVKFNTSKYLAPCIMIVPNECGDWSCEEVET